MHIFHLWHGWFFALFLFCAAIVFSNAFHWIVFRVLHRKQQELGAKTASRGLGLHHYLAHPARAIFIITCLFMVQPFLPVPRDTHHLIRHTLAVILVFSFGWFAAGMVYVLENLFLRRYDITVADNVRARRIHTQFQLFRRVIIGFIIVITAGATLWTFHDDRIWKAWTGPLASAGIASLILATAAKSTASNFLAGLQIAITEPIRIDDVVIVQGEWGNIEEITSAYVIVRTWDLRRLIVPLSYFIENSFQNWTRQSADILGYAYLYVDYAVPVEPLRQHMQKIVSAAKEWDGKVCVLQITNMKEKTMELRCLISARNSGDSFSLCCILREQMIAFIKEKYPEAFPALRVLAEPEKRPAAHRQTLRPK